MVEKKFCQATILQDGIVLGLINFEAIAGWMAELTKNSEPLKLFKDPNVKDIITNTLKPKNYRIIKNDTDFVTARQYFVECLGNPHPAEAMPITESGRRDEPVIGTITTG